jgi:ribosomal protein S18 acetylase RimI-like enzyme
MNEKEKRMISITQQPLTQDIKKRVDEGFFRHAIATTGSDDKHEPVSFVAMDGDVFVGAVVVKIFWGALHVKHVYVDEEYRGKGVGTSLMNHAIEYGQRNNCPFAFVETLQASGFYQKIGFQIEFTRHGYSNGTSFHYLRKDL